MTDERTSVHLILQCGKLLKNVSQLVSLSGSVVSVDLDEAAERLWRELVRYGNAACDPYISGESEEYR